MQLSDSMFKKFDLDSTLTDSINKLINSGLKEEKLWEQFCLKVFPQIKNFSIHKEIHSFIFQNWDENEKGPAPWWIPTKDQQRNTNLYKFIQKTEKIKEQTYEELHRWSVDHYDQFWEDTIKLLNIKFQKPFSQMVGPKNNYEAPKWAPDAKLNIAESCFQKNDHDTAIIFQKENGELQKMTQGELKSFSFQIAASLKNEGFQKGDAIAIMMPMTIESVALYLGIILSGCVAVSIADSFSPQEIETRLRISKAKAIFTMDFMERASKKLPLYERVKEAKANKIYIIPLEKNNPPQLRNEDTLFYDFLRDQKLDEACPCDPKDMINILFSSGTTGEPKAIPWSHLTPIKSAMDGYFHQDIQEGNVVCWPTNLGWMMGPWLIFATLINRGILALYYGAPTNEEFGSFVEKAEVNVLGLVPSIVKAWKKSKCMEDKNWEHIKCFSSTGECSNAEDYSYLMYLANYKPVIEYCGGTEIGGGYITGTLLHNASPATFTTPTLGLDIELLDENNKPAQEGEAFIIPPSLGLSETLLNRDHHEVYFKNTKTSSNGRPLRRHGDQLEKTAGQFFKALGRADDTMNLGGIKISSAEIERTIGTLDWVHESAAIGVSPKGGGPSHLVIYAIANEEKTLKTEKEQLLKELSSVLKKDLNPLFKVSDLVLTDSLPRTSSNKVMRRVLRKNYSDK
ncbi:MAG: AMP-dependent synthetase [Halobacteriovoraceae bacterium]|nr:AMP-dependent synthetase [Halobacteriovoraceae bacterium]